MKYAHIRLVTFDGHIPSRAQRVSRFFSLLLSLLPVGLGLAWAIFDEDHMSWHDRLSHTYPQKSRRRPNQLNSLANHASKLPHLNKPTKHRRPILPRFLLSEGWETTNFNSPHLNMPSKRVPHPCTFVASGKITILNPPL